MMYSEPAFPLQSNSLSYGMTLRDYFAAKAMQGFLANPTWDDESPEKIALMAYEQAAAMMGEREK